MNCWRINLYLANRFRRTALFVVLAHVALSSGCSSDCNYLVRSLGNSQCQDGGTTIAKSRKRAANCDGVINSRQVSISCPAGTVTNATGDFCSHVSNGASFYFVFAPDNGSGTYVNAKGAAESNCYQLWSSFDFNGGNNDSSLSNLVGVFFSGTDDGDRVSCTDSGGCTATSTNCIESWDSGTNSRSGVAASLSNGKQLVVCGFIDNTNAQAFAPGGPPPNLGAATSSRWSSAMLSVTVPATGPIVINTWTAY